MCASVDINRSYYTFYRAAFTFLSWFRNHSHTCTYKHVRQQAARYHIRSFDDHHIRYTFCLVKVCVWWVCLCAELIVVAPIIVFREKNDETMCISIAIVYGVSQCRSRKIVSPTNSSSNTTPTMMMMIHYIRVTWINSTFTSNEICHHS